MSLSRDFPMWNPWYMWVDPRRSNMRNPWDEMDEMEIDFPFTSSSLNAPSMTTDVAPVHRGGRGNFGPRYWTHHQAGTVKVEKKGLNELQIKAQLPGVDRSDISLELKEGDNESLLNLTVAKLEELNTTDRFGGSFKRNSTFTVWRSIPLGAKVNVDDIKADLFDDCLTIEVKLPTTGIQQKPASRIDIQASRKPISGSGSQHHHQQGHKEYTKTGKGEAIDTDVLQDKI